MTLHTDTPVEALGISLMSILVVCIGALLGYVTLALVTGKRPRARSLDLPFLAGSLMLLIVPVPHLLTRTGSLPALGAGMRPQDWYVLWTLMTANVVWYLLWLFFTQPPRT